MTARYVTALTVSVIFCVFYALSAYELRKAKLDDLTVNYKAWYDYAFIYGYVVVSAATAVGISWRLGV